MTQHKEQKFPYIETIDDVKPWIDMRDEFQIKQTPDFICIDYVYQQEGTFEHPEQRECRGIKFYPGGEIMSRPPHKFFNLGERRDLEDMYGKEDTSESWMKLDGSLIIPVFESGQITLGTKAGPTDVSRKCLEEIQPSLEFMDLVETMIRGGYTPCFEYTSPNNRIVVCYPEPRLTLICVRSTHTGDYLSFDDPIVRNLTRFVGIPDRVRDPVDVIRSEWKENEGIVQAWPNGFRLKVKADEYVLRHRARSYLDSEKTILDFIVNEKHDDLSGILEPDDFARLEEHSNSIWRNMHETAERIMSVISEASGLETRKDKALFLKDRLSPQLLKPAFSILDGKEPMEAVQDLARSKLGSSTKIEELRDTLFTPEWRY